MSASTDAWGTGSLCARVAAAASAARPALRPGPTASLVDDVVARLAEPTPRIAVGGRVKAGKSTLINALAGQEVAATAATECTKLVAWFKPSYQNRILVRRHDGTSVVVAGKPGGGVPADVSALGVPAPEIKDLVVELVNDRLGKSYTIVDTPGMDALSGLDEVAMSALAEADALIYVMPHPGQGDVEALEALRQQSGQGITATNVLGVLSRVDELGTQWRDPWPDARRLAAGYTRRLRGLVADTVPVVGLLAQTALGGSFTEADTRLVARLAAESEDAVDDALYSADEFRDWDASPLSRAERERLLALLGRYGIRRAVVAYRSGITGTAALLAQLAEDSGIAALVDELAARFVADADRLRAVAAVAKLEPACRGGGDAGEERALSGLRADLAELHRQPQLLQAELGAALADLASGRLPLADADATALITLATGAGTRACLGLDSDGTVEHVRAEAQRQVARWRTLEGAPSRAMQRHARAARELCEAIYFSVT